MCLLWRLMRVRARGAEQRLSSPGGSKRAPAASCPCPGLWAHALSQLWWIHSTSVVRKTYSPLWGYPTVYYWYFAIKIGQTVHMIGDKPACSRTMWSHVSPRDFGHWSPCPYMDPLQHLIGRKVAKVSHVVLLKVHELEMVSALMCLIVFAQPWIARGTSTLLI